MTLLLLATMLGAQPHDPVESVQVSSSISAPTAIMPMIDLYSECTTRAFNQGNQRARPRHAAGVRDIVDRGKAECADVRRRARIEAIRLIAGDSSIARGDREAVVDAALAAADRVGDVLVAGLEQAEAAETRGGDRPAAPNVRRQRFDIPSRPIRFEGPIAPAAQLYQACLANQTGPLGADLIAAYEAMLARCAETRATAIRRADALLVDAGSRDPEHRSRSIDQTFAAIDEAHRDEARRLRARLAVQGAPDQIRDDELVLRYRDEPHPNPLPFPAPIANFIGQYGNCISASLGRLPPSYPNPPVAVGGDCGPFRNRAFRSADQSLSQATNLGPRQRSELIEANLQNVEAFINGRPIPHPDAHRLPGELEPTFRRQRFDIPAQPFEFEAPIAPAVQAYHNCLTSSLGNVAPDVMAAFEASIARCAGTRAESITRADALLVGAGWRDPERRRRSIERTFSQIDESHRDHARQLRDRIGTLPTRTGSAAPNERPVGQMVQRGEGWTIPTEFVPAIIPYVDCLTASRGLVVQNNGRVQPPPPGINRGSDCGEYRRRAGQLMDRALRQRNVRDQAERHSRIEAALSRAEALNRPTPVASQEHEVEPNAQD